MGASWQPAACPRPTGGSIVAARWWLLTPEGLSRWVSLLRRNNGTSPVFVTKTGPRVGFQLPVLGSREGCAQVVPWGEKGWVDWLPSGQRTVIFGTDDGMRRTGGAWVR